MSEHTTSEAPASPEGRQAKGRFAKGNQFGPGNPFACKCAAFRTTLMDAVTGQDIHDIAARLRDDAEAGDKTAVKLLFQYVIGKPQPAVDPDTLDLQEMRGYMAAAIPPEVIEEMQRAAPLSLLLKLWPFLLYAQEQSNIDLFAQTVAAQEEQEQRRPEQAQQPAEGHQETQPPTRQPRPKAAATAPSTNGANGEHAPSTNGANGEHAPSTNGANGAEALATILDWFRRPRGLPNGDSQS